MVNFYSSLGLSSQIFRCSEDFREFLRKLLVCWRPHSAVGVPADASTVGISTISGIPPVAGLPSVVDVCDVLLLLIIF